MPKLRVRCWQAAVAAIVAVPLALTGCQDGSSGGGGGTTADASLSSVVLSAGTLNPATFAPDTGFYFLALPFGTSTFTVTPTATDPQVRSIMLAQDSAAPVAVQSGSPSAELTAPDTSHTSIVTLVVTGRDGKTQRTYGFVVSQTVNRDASLSALAVSPGTLSFAPATTTYNVAVPFGTTSFAVTPTAAGAGATLTVAQDAGAASALASGATWTTTTIPAPGVTSSIVIRVTAQDSSSAASYTIRLTQISGADATLASLTDSAGGLTGFASGTLSYSYLVPFQTAFTVTPTATNPLAHSITVNGATVATGTASQPIALTPGSATTITIVVTSQDQAHTQTYTLNVTEGPQAGLVTARTVPTGPSPLATVAANTLLPANDATGVPVDTLLRIGFDAAPTLGTTGTIRIYQVGNATPVDSINIADPYAVYDGSPKKLTVASLAASTKYNVLGGLASGIDQIRIVNYVPVLFSGNTAIIVPHNNKLAYGGQYYVTIDNGLLVGTRNGATFTGFAAPATPGTSDPSAWQFTVKATAPTTLNVAADNSADFATVQGAIDAVPVGSTATTNVINIAPGVYQEMLWIRKKTVTLKGTDSVATVIQYDNCDGFNPGTGGGQAASPWPPTAAATGGGRAVLLMASANGVVLDSITIKNLHGQGSLVIPTLPTPTTVTASSSAYVGPTFVNYSTAATQAETLYFNVSYGNPTATTLPGEPGQLVAKHSNFVSYQDTLQVKGYSWFYDCFITGDVDFIWGSANAALFERSEIKSRYNTNGAAVVQSRAYLNYLPGIPIAASNPTIPSTTTQSYAGFVFLNSALTKEAGDFTAYLARSPGAATTGTVGSGTAAAPTYVLFTQYDIVSFVNCSMDSHIAALGWNNVGGNPGGANLVSTPVVGWREYRSFTPAGRWLDVSGRLANPSPASGSLGGGLQLTAADVNAFFRDRATVFGGGTETVGSTTYTTTGVTWNPAP